MEPPEKKPHPERVNTDRSLRDERGKTDREIARRRDAVEEDADEVVKAARERADAVLESERADADDRRTEEAVPDAAHAEVAAERARGDEQLERERRDADKNLRTERAARARAIADLLRFERDETDRRLHLERDRADAVVATRDDFLGMVSHDLRTLLGGIAFDAALLMHDVPDDEHGRKTLHLAEHITRYVARMNHLVGDLLDVVSIEAGKLHVEPRHYDATKLLREILEAFQLTASARGIVLTTEVAQGSLLAKFDYERVLQVLANLVSNAIKFTEQGGTIAVRVEPFEGAVRFSVSDTGKGIAPELLGAIFERFWQSDGKTQQGLGLGLYISRCIVEAHGGRIWAESELGKGSTVHFTLPAAPSAEPSL